MPEYDLATLAIVCPVCCAAATAKCLYTKPTGGKQWMEHPHKERYEAAHPPETETPQGDEYEPGTREELV